MREPYFFGYGSLVNRDTHSHAPAYPARLRGWRRAWRLARNRPAAFLTILPDAGCEIDGLIAHVPGNDWVALDLREAAYARVPALDLSHAAPGALEVHVYTIPDGAHRDPVPESPVLLSYLDTVVQGFLREFGEDGVARFFDTTGGWHAPILDDRAAPRYSRARTLSAAERLLVDDHTRRLGVQVIREE